jgi:phenylacetate 2-hydroxylase
MIFPLLLSVLPQPVLSIPHQNAWAADYDTTHFKDPEKFLPERYLHDKSSDSGSATSGTPHYAYGAGSRMCAGSHLANRELYTAFIRLISAFRIVPAKDRADDPVLDALEANSNPTSLTLDPKVFKVGFRVRDRRMLDEWIRGSDERTRDL